MQDTPAPHLGEKIPLYFHNYRTGGKLIERGMPTGGMTLLGGPVGQIVKHAGA